MNVRQRLRPMGLVAAALTSSACIAMPVTDWDSSHPGTTTNTTTSPRTGSRTSSGALVSIDEAARRWGLQVDRSSSSLVALRGDGHLVLLRAAPRGSLVVDGTRISDDRITIAAGTMRLPPDLVARAEGLLPDRAAPTVRAPVVSSSGTDLHGRTVMIDAGHGGKDPGAPNRYGPPEKEITLDTALRVQRLLESWGARVLMTRTGDTYPSLDDRVALANRLGPDLYVSIHADSAQNSTARGFTVYLAKQASRSSESAAQHMVSALARSGVSSHGAQRADFRVVARTRVPALLVEMGFLTNPDESRRLSSSSHRQTLADAIARGVAAALSGAVPEA